jgi:hypothetical protein
VEYDLCKNSDKKISCKCTFKETLEPLRIWLKVVRYIEHK